MAEIKLMDFNINLQFPFVASMPQKGGVDRLVVSSCAIHLFADNRIWSGFEEATFSLLNRNNWSLGAIDFEIGLAGYTGSAYPRVYTKCFELRTDSGLRVKPMKFTNESSESKVNQRGETVIGMRYYFKSEEEIEQLVACSRLMFECFFALGDQKTVYGLMCQLRKGESGWEAEYANTYRPDYAKNIKSLND